MALHLKSTKSFKLLIGFSALIISGMAATFSVTGIATLFSGYFLTVAFMMGALEFGKIVVASFLARYWSAISRTLRAYFLIATAVLIVITSAGIFGYLSDAYQKTKGDYTIIEKQVAILDSKKNAYVERKDRLQADRQLEMNAKRSNQTRADSLTSRNQSITRTREDIRENDTKILSLEKQISAVEDSISSYDLKIIEIESQNIKGELGPLKYIAGIFDTDMDTAVKYFIFLLIFVFDPLAVILFVSLNTIIRKEHGIYKEDEFDDIKSSDGHLIKKITSKLKNKIQDDDKDKTDYEVKVSEVEFPDIEDESPMLDALKQTDVNLSNEPHNVQEIEQEQKQDEINNVINQKIPEPEIKHIEKKSANYHP